MLRNFFTAIFFSMMIFNLVEVSAEKMPVIVVNKFEQEIDSDIPLIDAGEFTSEVLIEQFLETGKFKVMEYERLEDLISVESILLSIIPKVDYVVSGKVKVEHVNENLMLGANFKQIAYGMNFVSSKIISATLMNLDMNLKNLRVTCDMNIFDAETGKEIWSGEVVTMENASAEIFSELEIYKKSERILCRNLLYIAASEIVFGEFCKSSDFEKMLESD